MNRSRKGRLVGTLGVTLGAVALFGATGTGGSLGCSADLRDFFACDAVAHAECNKWKECGTVPDADACYQDAITALSNTERTKCLDKVDSPHSCISAINDVACGKAPVPVDACGTGATFNPSVASAPTPSKAQGACPTGQTQKCFGSSSDTCYCSGGSTYDYCKALLNENPSNPVSTCAPYRGQGATCHSDTDCLIASGCTGKTQAGGCPTGFTLACDTQNDANVFSCITTCTVDTNCPDGQVCASPLSKGGSGYCTAGTRSSTSPTDGGASGDGSTTKPGSCLPSGARCNDMVDDCCTVCSLNISGICG